MSLCLPSFNADHADFQLQKVPMPNRKRPSVRQLRFRAHALACPASNSVVTRSRGFSFPSLPAGGMRMNHSHSDGIPSPARLIFEIFPACLTL